MPTPHALPSRLSPSRMKDFMQCPRLFYYKSILRISTPATIATAKGTVAHHAFERVFDLPQGERTPDAAAAYVRPAWEMLVNPLANASEVARDSVEWQLRTIEQRFGHLHEEGAPGRDRLLEDAVKYRDLVVAGSPDEEAFLNETEELVRAWFGLENPNKFDPTEREKYVHAEIGGAEVHGYIDRYDVVEATDGPRHYVSDYKTGKKVSPRFADEAFFQLEVYAVLLQKMLGVTTHQVRLLYVREGAPDAVLARRVDNRVLERTEQKISSVWKAIQRAHREDDWAPRRQVLCDWCYFKSVCPAHVPELEGLLPEEIEKAAGAGQLGA